MLSPPRKTYSSSLWLKVFVAVICLAILVLEGWRDWSERQQEFARVESEMKNLAKSLTQHAEDTFNLADAILVDVVDRIERQGASPEVIAGMQEFFSERIQTLQALKSLTVYDEDGFVMSSSLPGHIQKVNVQNQAFFQHHLTSPERSWFFGPIIRDPLGTDWVLTLSRRFNKFDGSFGGVVQVSIPPRYFANFFSRIDLGPQSSIGMISTKDGTLLSRYPYAEQAIGVQRVTSWLENGSPYGSRIYKSSIDGVTRLSGYQRDHVYPILLLTAVSQEEALASWTAAFQMRAFGVAVLVCIIAVLGWKLAGELKRREEVEAELAVLATTDGLTGIANRRAFDSRLQTEWLRASRDGTHLSLLLVDVDQFKSYNDIYGHQQGDECLRKITGVIASAVNRPSDFVARYGGEEIAVLLPDTNEAGTASVAEKIRAQVEALALRHEANPPSHRVTISIGSVTRKPAFSRSQMGAADLFLMADKALYRAKQGGRNRVATAKAA